MSKFNVGDNVGLGENPDEHHKNLWGKIERIDANGDIHVRPFVCGDELYTFNSDGRITPPALLTRYITKAKKMRTVYLYEHLHTGERGVSEHIPDNAKLIDSRTIFFDTEHMQ